MSDIKKIKDEFLLKLRENLDLNQVNQIKTDLFGKNGLISSQFKQLGKVAEQERKKFASDLNSVKDELQNLITSKINNIEIVAIRQNHTADLLYTNRISEVDKRYNKKYDIPSNFKKYKELNIDGATIYEVYKKIK